MTFLSFPPFIFLSSIFLSARNQTKMEDRKMKRGQFALPA